MECGILGEDDPVELIEGEIVSVPPQTPRHSRVIAKWKTRLVRLFSDTHDVFVQCPLNVGARSVPEPDFCLVPVFDSNPGQHPKQADLVIEVSFASLAYDRTEKASNYASGLMPELWILNLVEDQLEVFRNPQPDPLGIYGHRYLDTRFLQPGSSVTPLFAPQAAMGVSEMLLL